MSIPAQVYDLVERFDKHLADYKSGKYNETQVRREFIDPFFKALLWDVDNTKGYAEAYKEVVHEDAIKVGQATKAPDYSFRIGGTRKFFLEAKKPSVDIKHGTHPAYQLRRYGWSAKLPLSILTDFEEFAVYDCRIKPVKTDSAATARILYLTYTEYIERWDEIQDVFSPESIKTGSFDKYAQTTRSKRGTAEVDSAFLQEIERWRDMLARNLALRNNLTQRELNYAVQLTIDRLIFLRIAEDRSIEPYGQLKALLKSDNIYPNLVRLFARADDRYNSGLFHFRAEKNRATEVDSLTTSITLDDKVLTDILKNLYYPDSPYEFSVLPADILGQVYEQFLGKVIRLTSGGRAKVEEKPEVQKAGGVYYTPTFIVDYIVKQTVGKLFEEQQPGTTGMRPDSQLKILDPACGSGSFLLGAYQYLLDWYLEYYRQSPRKWSKAENSRLYERANGEWQLTVAERKRILTTHVYGVDIDPQAVEVTKLSLLLKVLEDDKSVTQQLALFQERVLPDLDENIKCGNSLVGPDFYASKPTQMRLFGDEEEFYRINAFDWQSEFREIMQAGGFDAVIGNPPYLAGREWTESLWKQRPYFKAHYSCMTDQYDLYALFIQKSLELLRNTGFFGFITPTTWLNNEHYTQLREWLIERANIDHIGDFRDVRVFRKATVLPIVLIATKEKEPNSAHTLEVAQFVNERSFSSIETSVSVWKSFPDLVFNLSISKLDFPVLKKIEHNSSPLSTWNEVRFGVKVYQEGKGKPPQTSEEAKHKLFEADEKLSNEYYPYIRGKYVTPWLIDDKRAWIRYGDHLAEPRTIELFTGPRILVRRIVGDRLIIAATDKTSIADQLLHTVKAKKGTLFDYRYFAGFLRSRLIAFYFRKRFNRTEKTFPEIRVAELRQLPIPVIELSNPTEKAQHDKMVALVEQILALHQQLALSRMPQQKTMLKSQIEISDQQIDALVYELNGLTDEEIAIVEGSTT
jgi:type I restriction-modification system DNA methylase subunit